MRRRSVLASLIILFALALTGVGPISAEEPGDLEVDTWTEVTFDVFTVDRIYLNRYGGITAEGAPEWLAHPAVLCVGGSWLVPRGADITQIQVLALQAASLAR